MSADWENFIRDIPASVFNERLPRPTEGERPGSRDDMEMRAAHDFVRRDYWGKYRAGHPHLDEIELRQRRRAEQEQWVAQVVAARAADQIHADVAAYAAQKKQDAADAAHTRGNAA